MARYSTITKFQTAKLIQEAVHFFGPGGIGLDVKECADDCARFEGGGGHVLVQLCEVDAGVEVELETREWDYDAKQFLEKI
jgi:hypothetical protein